MFGRSVDAGAAGARVPVWDPVVRLSHWLLAALVLLDFVVDDGGWLHRAIGYVAVAVVAARLFWAVVALVLEGDEAIEVVRALNGATDGRKAAPGTIRGDLSLSNRENLVHGSDSEESAAREIGIWFSELSA